MKRESQSVTSISCPPSSIRTRPLVARLRPLTQRSSVDLPEPERPHENEDLAGLHLERGVLHAHHLAGLLEDAVLVGAGVEQGQRLPDLPAEDHVGRGRR